jgi:hypothetical protein
VRKETFVYGVKGKGKRENGKNVVQKKCERKNDIKIKSQN